MEEYEIIQEFLDKHCDGVCKEECEHWCVNGCQSPDNPNNKEAM